jgi:hypothetical protein
MDRLILSEKIDRIDNLQSLQEWFNHLLRDAGVQVLVRKSDDKWLCIETDNPSLFLSTLNLQVYYPLEPVEKPILRTCWIEKIQGNVVTCSYPLSDGSTMLSRHTLNNWIAYLGFKRNNMRSLDVLKNTGVDVDYPINITLEQPSILYRKLLEKLIIKGLDVVFLRGLTPLEIDGMLNKGELGKYVADFTYLTLTTHILYVKLGIRPQKVIENVITFSSKLHKHVAYKVCEWENLELASFFLKTCV